MPAPDMTANLLCAGCAHSYAETALFCPHCGRPKVREGDGDGDAFVGKVLGERFQVLALLGQGASGTIYRAEHVTLRRKVAIKVLHHELSRDDLAIERFRREATTVAEIDNEHIVEIHDFGRAPDGRLYLAMELLEGETLDRVLAREGTLSVERTADILIQLGEALMEAHAIGYVHRDLRPRNVYLAMRRGKANFVKLLDFGLAKLVETDASAASTSLGMTFGDPRYMAPEQARGDRIDRRADIYQLGCVAYELLTGAPPFTGARVFEILTKQVTEAPAPLPSRRRDVPLWMEAAVAKMLAKDPENRFATTTRLAEALRRGLETGEIMEDDVARRRESIPPPSVSRVMSKLGLSQPIDPPPAPAFSGTQTVRGHFSPDLVAPTGAATAPERPDSVELLRKRTGTPRLGVPVPPTAAAPARAAGAVADVGAAPALPALPSVVVAGATPAPASATTPAPASAARPAAASAAEPAAASAAGPAAASAADGGGERGGRAGRDARDEQAISQVWFDDEEPGDRAQRARRTISPSTTDLTYEDELPRGRRAPLWIGAGLAVLAGGIALAMSLGGGEPARGGAAPAIAAAPVEPPPPSAIIEPSGSGAGSGDAGSAGSAAAAGPAPTAAPRAGRPAPPTGPAPRAGTPRGPAGGTSSGGRDDLSYIPPPDTGFRRPGGSGLEVPPGGSGSAVPVGAGSGSAGLGSAGPGGPGGVSGSDAPLDPYGAPEAPAGTPAKQAEFYASLGTQQLAAGDLANAAASFKKARELDPRNAAALTGQGEIALRQGLFGDALAHLQQAARLTPRSSRVHTLLGESHLATGRSADAAAAFKQALLLDPENARARDGYHEASSRVPPPSDE